MATKKATTAKSKATKTSPKASPKTTTKVTTVRATESRPKRSLSLPKVNFQQMPVIGAAIAEFVGTFLLVSLILVNRNDPVTVAFGLIGIAMMLAVFSGAHVNPAITIGSWVTRKLDGIRTLGYLVAQSLGAMLAYVTVSAYLNASPSAGQEGIFGQAAASMFSVPAIPEGFEWGVFFAEVIGLAILGFAFASAYRNRERVVSYALTVGFGIFVAVLLTTGLASYIEATPVLHPAAAFAAGGIEWEVWPIASYIVAPVLGSILGFGLHQLLYSEKLAGDYRQATKKA